MSSTNRGAERTPNDAYYTPDMLATALIKVLRIPWGATICEPHAGGGAFMRALTTLGHGTVWAMDIDPAAPALRIPSGFEQEEPGYRTCGDFLTTQPRWGDGEPVVLDWIVGNPPFKDFEKHVDRALELAPNVAFLLRLAAMESASRAALWRRWPLQKVWVLAERPSFTGGGTDSAAYGLFRFGRSFKGHAEIVPGWSWKGGPLA